MKLLTAMPAPRFFCAARELSSRMVTLWPRFRRTMPCMRPEREPPTYNSESLFSNEVHLRRGKLTMTTLRVLSFIWSSVDTKKKVDGVYYTQGRPTARELGWNFLLEKKPGIQQQECRSMV